jgi:SM-20-related protein
VLDWLTIGDFLDAATLARWRSVLAAAVGDASTVLSAQAGGRVAPQMRRSTRLVPGAALDAEFVARIEAHRRAIETWYGSPLGACEPPQFLRYTAGDYFVAHQDGNTPLVHDRSRHRRVSIVVVLSARDDYAGGELVLHGGRNEPDRREPLAPSPGTLIAFRAETTHEVAMVDGGERHTIATWLLARDA